MPGPAPTQHRCAGFGLRTCYNQVPGESAGWIHSNEDHRAHSQKLLSVSFSKGVCWEHDAVDKHMNFYGKTKWSALSGFKLSMTIQWIFVKLSWIPTLRRSHSCHKTDILLKKKKQGEESRWRRNRTGDHFLFYKFIERTTERWTKITKQLLIASSGRQAPRKAAHCLRREVGQGYWRLKRETRERGTETRPGKGVLLEGVSNHQETLALAGPGEVFKSQRAT